MTVWFHIIDDNEERMSLERMNSTKLILVMLIAILSFPVFANVSELDDSGKIVITQADEEAIKGLLKEYHKEFSRRVDGLSSSSLLYVDCEAYRKLLKYGLKVVPYLVQNIARLEAQYGDYAYIGSALIDDKSVKTPEQVHKYNRSKRWSSTGPGPPVSLTLMQLLPDSMKPKPRVKKGYVDNKVFAWSHWWQGHRHKFIFQTKKPLVIHPAKYVYSMMPQIRTTVKNGLLDLYAVSATYRQVIERAAAEMNVDVFIGEQQYIGVITTVRMKSVTFEEFLYIIGRTVFVGGFNYRKTEKGYWVGGKNPAKPRPILHGWGIMMEKTVFSAGAQIPVTIITRLPGSVINPADPVFSGYGSFRVTTNDGKIVKDYEPLAKARPTIPPIQIQKDCCPIQVLLDKFCKLPSGEYNIRFRYLNHETPSIAVEIYDRQIN